jgi:hypothetical protein
MSNPHIDEILAMMRNRWSRDSLDMTMGDWIVANTTLRGRPFTFDRYPLQKQIADDMHPNMDVVKPSQVGLSEIQVRKSLAFVARNNGASLIFTLPDQKLFDKMSGTRILPVVNYDKAFNLADDGGKPIRSRSVVQIGKGFLYVTAASEGDATSTSADAVMNDEVDLTDQKMLVLFNSRLQNSDFKINQRFSTPSFLKFGIDQGYSNSDQHEYMVRCDSCRHTQIPTFTRRFVELSGLSDDFGELTEITQEMMNSGKLGVNESYFCCEKCRAPLDLGRADNREWVARFPSRDHHRGYRVRPGSTHRIPPGYILQQMIKYMEKNNLRGWKNTVLGEADSGGNQRLNEADILACFTGPPSSPAPNLTKPRWIGIDVGLICHIVVTEGWSVNDQDVLLFETCQVGNLQNRVGELMSEFRIFAGGVDRFPYTPEANALFEMSGGKVFPIQYRGADEVRESVDKATNVTQHLTMNRTMLLDQVAKAVRGKLVRFSGYGIQQEVITEHLKDLVREDQPEKEAVWVKLTGTDHYFHALAFAYGAITYKEMELGISPGGTRTIICEAQDIQMKNLDLRGNAPRKALM